LVTGLRDKFEDVMLSLLLPLFFAYTGLRMNVGLLGSREAWLLCLSVLIVAIAGKLGGAALAAGLSGMPWHEAWAVGILMNTRGLVELIILNVGLDLGVISPVLFTMLVLMALATTVMTTPLLDWLGPTARERSQIPVAETTSV
jgi:Kef-type K+ transport system membrane component KefB